MDAKSVFITVALIVLANGAVLSVVLFDAPSSLRPAARLWQWATLLVSIGCLTFVFTGTLPAPVELLLANGAFLGALCLYHAAIRKFHGLSGGSAIYVFVAMGAIPFVYFATADPDISARLFIAAILWGTIMWSSTWVLLSMGKSAEFRSISNATMSAIYILALLVTIVRTVIYLIFSSNDAPSIADNSHWLNSVAPVFLSILPVIGTTAFLFMCSDQMKRRWQDAASRDALTELPNRRALMAYGQATVESPKTPAERVAVAILDIDDFKSINDNHGHNTGDIVLRELSSRIRGMLNVNDFFARSGGEEFVLIFGGRSSAVPEKSAESVRRAVAERPFWVGHLPLSVTVSIGVVLHQDADSFTESLARADQALYAAKNGGRNQVIYAG